MLTKPRIHVFFIIRDPFVEFWMCHHLKPVPVEIQFLSSNLSCMIKSRLGMSDQNNIEFILHWVSVEIG